MNCNLTATFFSHSCCQRALHVIGQEGCGSVDDPIGYHHGYKVAGCADGVEGRGSAGEMLVSCVGGDPEQQTWCHLQRRQACVSCVVRKQRVNNSVIHMEVVQLYHKHTGETLSKVTFHLTCIAVAHISTAETHSTCISFDEIFEGAVKGFKDEFPLAPLTQIFQQRAGE